MEFKIRSLGKSTILSKLKVARFVSDDEFVMLDSSLKSCVETCGRGETPKAFEKAGPRERLFFDPNNSRAAIVTCGGLCPGLNDVIRALVMCLYYRYGVKKIFGARYGYAGFVPELGHEMMPLDPASVTEIHKQGGTILGSSRGPQDTDVIVDTLDRMSINMLFTIGGDGTQRGAHEIANKIEERGLKISVIGIPKTIDNDIKYIEKSFGFETAFTEASRCVSAAHEEARGAYNGIGLLKLMGRHSGFIAASAAIAMSDVDYVIVPEVPFRLDGEGGFFPWLRNRLGRRHHAVVVVAEGAGQDLFPEHERKIDKSGNLKLLDIGPFMKQKIQAFMQTEGIDGSVKYIDPSYIIRAAPAVAADSLFCAELGHHAVHAAMAGKTDLLVGAWSNTFTHIPIATATTERNQIDPHGSLWRTVLESTGQPECY